MLFDPNIIDTCTNLISTKEFFNKYKDKGGIYLIKYLDNDYIYYIGRAKIFKHRLKMHLKPNNRSKLHLFANLVGWDKFSFSIIEICNLNVQKERENYY